MTDDSFRCRRCGKQITPMRHLCHTCATVEGDSPLDIDPAAAAAFVADSAGGTAGDTAPDEGVTISGGAGE